MPLSSREYITGIPDCDVDRGWAWAVVFSTFMMRLIVHGVNYCAGIYYVEFLKYFNTTSGAASLVMSILLGMTNFTGPIASALITKYSCRTVSFLGSLISCIGLLLSLAVPSVEYLYLTLGLITGFGFGLLFLPTITAVALHFEKKRATAMGISSAGSGIGSLILVPFTEWLIEYYCYWKGALLITTGLVMNCFILSFFYCKQPSVVRTDEPIEDSSDEPEPDSSSDLRNSLELIEPRNHLQNHQTIQEKINAKNSPLSFKQSKATSATMPLEIIRSEAEQMNRCSRFTNALYKMLSLSLLKNHVFLIFSISRSLQYFGVMTPSIYMYHRAKELGIATYLEASFLLSLIGVSNTLGKILIGIFADYTSWSVLYIYAICLLINGIATMMTSLFTHYYMMSIYCFVFGLTFGATINLTSIVLVKLFGLRAITNTSGLIFLFSGLAITIGSPLPGVLYDIIGNYAAGFYLSGALISASGLIIFVIPIVKKKFPQ
ncbi:monocarboxylate transporter 12 [Nephila pilipes]|uniref:Monocarboxylate transporter 12 n=1 Tax=Nephila pilipes TaxID=299642 RepID=A0A8X6TYB5_NEPPI|nr:monocarboxylate transporter 12 [Nephila pilipes]